MTGLPSGADVPALGVSRMLVIATGSVASMFFPSWLFWLRSTYPGLEVRYVITPAASRFVGTHAVAACGGAGMPVIDAWDAVEAGRSIHIEWASWPEAIVVHPATFAFTARFAAGLADSPALLALQTTSVPVVIAPSLPPGGVASPAYATHVKTLSARPNVAVAPPMSGPSLATGADGPGTVAPFPVCLRALEQLRRRQEQQ